MEFSLKYIMYLGPKSSFNKEKKIEIRLCSLSALSGKNLQINSNKNYRTLTKLNVKQHATEC